MAKGKADKVSKNKKEAKEMKYKTLADCPENVKQLNPEAQEKWMSIANACIAAGDGKDFAESRAWQAIKECWTQNEKGEWTKLVSATGFGGFFSKEEIEKKGYKLEDPTHELKGVEIFASGKWNGDEYSDADLDEIVKNFEKGVIKNVPLKVGHDDGQKVAGQPAVGIVQRLYKVGKKILADIGNIPKVVAELINKKAYHGVSAEIAWNADFDGSVFKRLLTGVALLGAEIPAVNKLETIPAVYKAEFAKVYDLDTNEKGEIKEAGDPENKPEGGEAGAGASGAGDPPKEGNPPAEDQGEKEKAELQAKLKKAEDEKKELEAKLKTFEDEKAKTKEAEEKKSIETFASKLVEQKKIVPAMKERITRSLEQADNISKKEYSIDGKKIEETSRDNLMRIYEGLSELKLFTEAAHSGTETAGTPAERAVSLAKKYVEEKKHADFKTALDQVYIEHPDWHETGKPIRA